MHDRANGGPTVRFTEKMGGFVAFGEEDCERGYERGRELDCDLMFKLTIETSGIGEFASDPMHAASATGYVRCEALGGRLPVEAGAFNLFVDAEVPGEKRMLYRLPFADATGRPLTLTGHKVIADDPGLDAWRDTTTLFTRVLRGHVGPGEDDAAEVVAAGILRIRAVHFAQQLTTFRARGGTAASRALALIRFNVLFSGALWQVYRRDAPAYLGLVAAIAATVAAVRRVSRRRFRGRAAESA